MTELQVPHAAWTALQYVQDERDVEAVRAIAAPVVAAELRTQAAAIATHSAGLAQLYASRLRARADEIDGVS